MEREKDLIVTLRCYRGKVTRDYDTSKVNSENAPVKLAYGRLEWINFMKSARISYSKIEIEKVTEETISYKDGKSIEGKDIKIRQTDYKEIEPTAEMIDEVRDVMKKEEEKLTPEQQRIADLEAKIEALSQGSMAKVKPEPQKEVKKEEPKEEGDTDLQALRDRYEELYNKQPNHLMKAITLQKKIEEKENENS